MKVNSALILALVGLGLLAAGVGWQWGWPMALIVVGALLLLAAVIDVLSDMRGKP